MIYRRKGAERVSCFFFQAEDGIRGYKVTRVQTCALPISLLHQEPVARTRSLHHPVDDQDRRAAKGGIAMKGRTAHDEQPVVNAMSVDVEDYFHVSVRSEERRVGRGGRSGYGSGRARGRDR